MIEKWYPSSLVKMKVTQRLCLPGLFYTSSEGKIIPKSTMEHFQ